ncbi:glutamate formimidoyltransferase [bacterium]|nr:glutamate formimidoyltransferase [bacterium]
MAKIVECVPNISEGRNSETVEACLEPIRQTDGVKLLDYSSDPDHNRTVITYAGTPEGCADAAFGLAQKAAELIDLTKHEGGHPRMGAVDVIPFVPVSGVKMEDCAELARTLGARMWEELKIPVFLYEQAASKPSRRNLANVRKGEFEGMAEKMKDAKWAPDFGENAPHPTAGVTAVGARTFLVAYNINLNTDNLKVGKKIVKCIREAKGGLVSIKAMALMLEDRNQVQISMNLTSPFDTPMYRVFELVRLEAARYAVDIVGSEVVGLVPLEALVKSMDYYLRFEGFKSNQIIEMALFGD